MTPSYIANDRFVEEQAGQRPAAGQRSALVVESSSKVVARKAVRYGNANATYTPPVGEARLSLPPEA